MGTPHFSVPALEKIHAQFQVIAVYTQPDRPVGRGLELQASPVKKKAIELGISVFQPEKLTLPGELEKLQALKPDVIVVAAYGQILKRNVLELPRLGCVNIHSSLLPRWRGAAPIQWAILGGDSVSGITTMKMAEKLDAGDIYLQKETAISESDTSQTLHDRLSQIGSVLIVETLVQLESGLLRAIQQDESKVTYASKLTKEMEAIDCRKTALEVDRQIRALTPWPGTSFTLESGERIKVKKALLVVTLNERPGYLVQKDGRLFLSCSTGGVELLEIQAEGKKAQDAKTFLNGLKGQGRSLPLALKIS